VTGWLVLIDCSKKVGVDNHSSFGYSLSTCRDAVIAKKCAPDGFFYYSENYNGQCSCATDSCAKRVHNAVYNIYEIVPDAPPTGLDMTVDFAEVGLAGAKAVEVMDIWAEASVGTHEQRFTAANVAVHGTAFLRLTPKPKA
jgi:hypothetical protein